MTKKRTQRARPRSARLRPNRPRPGSLAWGVAAVLAVAGVLWVTVREDKYVTWSNLTGSNLVPLEHHLAALRCVLRDCENADAALYYLLLDVVGNVLLFIPVGLTVAAALPLRSRLARLGLTTLMAMLLSTSIEAIQLLMPSRATDVDDVLFNTLGALTGALVALPLLYKRRRPRTARR